MFHNAIRREFTKLHSAQDNPRKKAQRDLRTNVSDLSPPKSGKKLVNRRHGIDCEQLTTIHYEHGTGDTGLGGNSRVLAASTVLDSV